MAAEMTMFERDVWTAAYAAAWMEFSALEDMHRAGEAFEAATYAVLALRRIKIEPVFGPDCGTSSRIEDEVLLSVGNRR